MKAKVTVLVLALLLLSFAVARAEDGVGIGVILGEPTGISVKKWITDEHALDAAAAWSFSENDSFQFHADYLFHDFGIFHSAAVGGRLPAYVGIGGRVKLEDHDGERGRNEHDSLLGIRIPLGISYILAKAPVEFFAELVPILDIVPDTEFDLNVAVGARFYLR